MSLTYLLPDIDYLIKSLLDLLNKWQAADAWSVHVWFFKGILIIYIWYKIRSYIDTELANLMVERAIRKYYNMRKHEKGCYPFERGITIPFPKTPHLSQIFSFLLNTFV